MTSGRRASADVGTTDEAPAFDLLVTTSIKADFKDLVSKIYESIRHGHGEENPVLEETGKFSVSICVSVYLLVTFSWNDVSNSVHPMQWVVVSMICDGKSITNIKEVLRDFLLENEVATFVELLEEGKKSGKQSLLFTLSTHAARQ